MNGFIVFAFECFLLTLIFLSLSINVIKKRRYLRVAIGHGNQTILQRAIAAHKNFIDYVSFALILQLALAALNAPAWLILLLAIMLVAGRISHALSILKYELLTEPLFHFRVIGMSLTFSAIFISSIALIVQAFIFNLD